MKHLRRLLCLTLSIALSLSLIGCGANSQYSFENFNSVVTINTKDVKQQTIDKIKLQFNNLDKEFSVMNGTFTYNFNNLNAGESIIVSDTAKTVLDSCFRLYNYTNGKFNPAVYPLVKLWGFSPNNTEQFKVPESDSINQILDSGIIDFSLVKTDQNSNFITKLKDNVMLDFGGVLKGYASDLALKILIQDGIKSGYVSVGGSSIAVLNSNLVKIRHPENRSSEIISVNTASMQNFSLSTSGTYEKYHKIGDTVYSHIINSETGKPTDTGIISATVIGTDGITAEALSTALCLLEFDKSNIDTSELTAFIKKIEQTYIDAHIYCIYKKGNDRFVITNKIIDKDFTILDSDYKTINI